MRAEPEAEEIDRFRHRIAFVVPERSKGDDEVVVTFIERDRKTVAGYRLNNNVIVTDLACDVGKCG